MKPVLVCVSVIASLGVIACSANEVASTAQPLTSKQSELLAKSLKDRTPGKPVSCINSSSSENFVRVSDSILLYPGPGSTIYQNNLRSNCPGLARDDDIIVIEKFGSSYCQGDLIRLVDRTSGIQGPVCSLGEFTPYRKHTG